MMPSTGPTLSGTLDAVWEAFVDLNNLATFVAIAESGSFSEAGERLHLTQPAVSKRIATLEQQLAARLFDRLGREIRLTEAGRALLPRAYQLLGVLDDTRRALRNLSNKIEGRLLVATSHHIGLHRLPAVLRRFIRRYPDVALDIRFLDSEVSYEEVLQGRAEIAVVTLAPEHRPHIRPMPLWEDALDFVVASDHPLARCGGIDLHDLAAHPAIFPGDTTFTHRIVRELFQARGLTPNIGMSTNYLETIKMMVSIGLAWSVLPRTLLDEQLIRLPIPDIQLSRQLGYILHTERTLSNAARAFMTELEADTGVRSVPHNAPF